jgi:integrase
LGEYPIIDLKEARKQYAAAAAQVKLLKNGLPGGADPVQVKIDKKAEREEHRKTHTVAELVQEYIEKHAMTRKKSWAEDKRCLEKEVVPVWGRRKAKDVTKRDVVLLLEGIVERGSPVMANNAFEKIRKMFNFAVERSILDFSPCYGVKKLTKTESKDRVLSADEIKKIWSSIDVARMSDDIRRALKLILVTAQRPGEVIGMHSSEIDGKWWTIPAERAKNGRTHRVYLTEMALELIGDLKVIDEETGKEVERGYIFPCPHGKKIQPIDGNAVAGAVRRNQEWPVFDKKGKQLYTSDGKPATENLLMIDKFTPHDLRRTAATGMGELQFRDEVIDAVLNHVKKGVIATYNRHGYDQEKQQALEAWERKLLSIIASKEIKVLSLIVER